MNDIYFTPRELDVMSVLWRHSSATVAEVRKELGEDLAYTTVLSALQVLTEKGYVTHEVDGRAYRYRPTVEPERAGASALDRIRDAVFLGSSERLFVQLIGHPQLTAAELARMRKLLNDRVSEEEGR